MHQSDIDYPAPIPFEHLRQDGSRGEENSRQVPRNRGVPLFNREFVLRRNMLYSDVVDQDVDTPEHVRAAWSYINHKDNAAKYDKDEVRTIKERIKRAAKKHGVEISED